MVDKIARMPKDKKNFGASCSNPCALLYAEADVIFKNIHFFSVVFNLTPN